MRIQIVEPDVQMLVQPDMLKHHLHLCELAGRTCYKTENKITKFSAGPFVKGIVAKGHESVIEHGHATFWIRGSRSMSHQLVRHRMCEYSQESQRYCDYDKKGFTIICPPDVQIDTAGIYTFNDESSAWESDKGVVEAGSRLDRWLCKAAHDYEEYLWWKDNGLKSEDAREVLPNATKTELVVTANFRQWRHMIKQRGLNPHAQWQIRGIFLRILDILNTYLPDVFGDLKDE